jgi:hypothetical protein
VRMIQAEWEHYEDTMNGVVEKQLQLQLRNRMLAVANITERYFSDFLFGAKKRIKDKG